MNINQFSTLAGGALALALTIGATSCGDDELEAGPGVYSNDFTTSASYFTLMSGMKVTADPHDKVQIWYSSNIKTLLEDGDSSFTVPVGTVAVKKFENDTGTGIVVMIKKEAGYDSANNDWYYDMRDDNGNIVNDNQDNPIAGKVAMCISCHAAASAKDYLAGTALR